MEIAKSETSERNYLFLFFTLFLDEIHEMKLLLGSCIFPIVRCIVSTDLSSTLILTISDLGKANFNFMNAQLMRKALPKLTKSSASAAAIKEVVKEVSWAEQFSLFWTIYYLI